MARKKKQAVNLSQEWFAYRNVYLKPVWTHTHKKKMADTLHDGQETLIPTTESF